MAHCRSSECNCCTHAAVPVSDYSGDTHSSGWSLSVVASFGETDWTSGRASEHLDGLPNISSESGPVIVTCCERVRCILWGELIVNSVVP